MIEIILWILLLLLLWIISIFFNDVEDTLAHHYKDSIFDCIPKDDWFSWYMQDPAETWIRKYVNNDPSQGRKKMFGMPIPAFMFDGWHGAKFTRQIFQYLTIYAAIYSGLEIPFLLGFALFGISNYVSHSKLFYGGMLLKSWWQTA